MIHILIIEKDKLIANSLKEYLENEFNVVNVFNSIEHFLAEVDSKVVPDIVILDVVLPGLNGILGIPVIKELFPDTNILIYNVVEDDENIYKALSNGAIGYISKEHTLEEIANILKIIYDGGAYMSPIITRKILKFFKPQRNIFDDLTTREKEVAESILKALSYKMISLKLNISIDTVRKHIKNIYKKLNINSKTELFLLKEKAKSQL
jgi:DNA-binding NarL/FixJ family response regulator